MVAADRDNYLPDVSNRCSFIYSRTSWNRGVANMKSFKLFFSDVNISSFVPTHSALPLLMNKMFSPMPITEFIS